jgi:urease accessory protein
MDIITMHPDQLLLLLQLASPSLPVGAYSYSEGLESLVDGGIISNGQELRLWLEPELRYGAIRLDAAVMVRAYRSVVIGDIDALCRWNAWLSAARETEELRCSSWQMGRSLILLMCQLESEIVSIAESVGNPCNYAIAFGMAAAHWQIDLTAVLLGYLHSWVTNAIAAGVKLIPLGQTTGQQLLMSLHPHVSQAVAEIFAMSDDDLSCCSWGLSLASMAHEIQYTRLFRS